MICLSKTTEFLESSWPEIKVRGRRRQRQTFCPACGHLQKGLHISPSRHDRMTHHLTDFVIKHPECLLLYPIFLPWRHFVFAENALSGLESSPTAQICALRCLSAHPYSSRACRSPSSFYSFLSVSHSPTLLSFRVLSSHPSSQSSFISRISLPVPPQPETSQSLASFPPTLPV